MNYRTSKYFIYGISICIFIACKKDNPSPSESNQLDPDVYQGGQLTIFDGTLNAFGNAYTGLTNKESSDFINGNSFFRNNWVAPGATTVLRDGLGPMVNGASCSSCHLLDGRGKPDFDEGLLLRLSVKNATGQYVDDPNYGGQFNHRSIMGVTPEGTPLVVYSEQTSSYPDGTTYSLRKPSYSFTNLNYGNLDPQILFSPRVGQQVFGLGLLEAISENQLLENQDVSDIDGDGISGRANYITDPTTGERKIGKIGWKANVTDLLHQTSGAFLGDIGITSSLNPNQNLSGSEFVQYGNLPNGGNPEIADSNIQKVVFYLQTLMVPARRNSNDQQVILGKAKFVEAKCDKCHKVKWQTGTHPSVSYLSNQTIFPYSDWLLHDMGPDLADNRPDYEASGTEWRTQPLWGIGLIKVVNGHSFLLHDGRARNIEEAILWHGGEATNSKNTFMNFTKSDRTRLIKFIESL